MATITQYYGITGGVDFLDVGLSKDNLLFVDPHSIRLQAGVFASQANHCTSTFFDEITRCVISVDPKDKTRGLELLQRFKEPKETRLGYSENGIDGHGAASVIGEAIWVALSTNLNAFVQVGLMKLLEDVPVFVENVANDITSDLTTRIVFEPLVQFTQSMVSRHPEFKTGGQGVQTCVRQVWDPAGLSWIDKPLDLPVADNKPLVLVPRDWARGDLLMSSGRYYDTTMLSFVQDEETVIDVSTGKPLRPPKDTLKKRPTLARGTGTIIRVTQRALAGNTDLLDRFRAFVNQRYAPLSDDAIARRIR
jgi:hypothetical protein